jgi:hypothetical protein
MASTVVGGRYDAGEVALGYAFGALGPVGDWLVEPAFRSLEPIFGQMATGLFRGFVSGGGLSAVQSYFSQGEGSSASTGPAK